MAKQSSSSFPWIKLICAVLLIAVAFLGWRVYTLMNEQTDMQNTLKAQTEIKLPANAVKITECIPHEGEHWVEPANVPNGPYYVTYKGRVLSLEYMVSPDEIPGEKLAKGSPDEFMRYVAANNLTLSDIVNQVRTPYPLTPAVYKTVHIGWTAPHAGFTVPHYDIHFDLVTPEELKNVCPDSRLEDVYSPEVIQSINKNNIPFPGQ